MTLTLVDVLTLEAFQRRAVFDLVLECLDILHALVRAEEEALK